MIVGVIGCGVMGKGIAQVFAQNNIDVVYCDKNAELSVKAKQSLAQVLEKLVARNKITSEDKERILSHVKPSLLEDCAACDLVVDCISEDLAKKQILFKQLDAICNDNCIFATNTSSLSIRELGKGLKHQLIGMHFFNPAPVMNLVEVVKNEKTKESTVEFVLNLCKLINKVAIVVKEAPGFIVNRLLIPMINDAISMLENGIASAQDIDSAMKLGANHVIGPLALADLIGLDVVLAIMQNLEEQFNNKRYEPCALLKKMVADGQLGKKVGKGFYNYN